MKSLGIWFFVLEIEEKTWTTIWSIWIIWELLVYKFNLLIYSLSVLSDMRLVGLFSGSYFLKLDHVRKGFSHLVKYTEDSFKGMCSLSRVHSSINHTKVTYYVSDTDGFIEKYLIQKYKLWLEKRNSQISHKLCSDYV